MEENYRAPAADQGEDDSERRLRLRQAREWRLTLKALAWTGACAVIAGAAFGGASQAYEMHLYVLQGALGGAGIFSLIAGLIGSSSIKNL